MNVEVELAGLSDAGGLADLHYLSHIVSFAQFASPEWLRNRDRSDYLRQWDESLKSVELDDRSRAWKVLSGRLIVGMVKVGPMSESEAQLSSMHVHPNHHRKGIGSLLMTTAIDFMRESGYSSASLGVIQENTAARAIYERYGWTVRELSPTGVEGVPIAVYDLVLKRVEPS